MNIYRLHIDIPLTDNLEDSKELSEYIVSCLSEMAKIENADYFQYKLSHDLDRSNKNYLDINENGHCSNKKIKVVWR
jgi:hypothetical protein